jgi:short subunit dehydrogenase-like uncharacterized protein
MQSMARDSELDIVIYGATGYTGRLVAQYFLQRYGNTQAVRWAMAGRDLGKLREVRDEIGALSSIPLILADAGDADSLRAMAEQTRVVLSTVGPYQLYGSQLVACCVDADCDYVDLCGEPAWMRQMIDTHQEKARHSGARIVFSCGFDSVPFDLGVYFLQQTALQRFEEPLPRVKGRVRRMKGGFSGGTIASLRAARAEADKDPFLLTPGFHGPMQPDGSLPVYDEELQSWAAPFVMADINTRNVHRSNALLGHCYGTNFSYDEMLLTGSGEKGEAVARAIAGRELLPPEEASPQPGEGPSKAEREAGTFDLLFTGFTQDGSIIQASVTGDQDPGYGSTSKMIAESALCLIEESADTPGGLWTPASAMGAKLIQRLSQNAGLRFALE